ncbi:MAG TPA: TrkH family potassium uptake protein [Syntrophomonadaceae bacterium]|nr:TrkH family potassium uptake protein [Syntrophomonadaceae bacterium]
MNNQAINPPKALIGSFLLVVLAGTLLLSLPFAVKTGTPDILAALFTSASAACVTGLVVVDTASHWTVFGQVVILLLIQVGGLGLMTFVTYFFILMGRRLNLKQKMVLQFALNRGSMEDLIKIIRYLLVISLLFEAAGTLILFLHWWPEMGAGQALWYALFHAVSAFNNAGFDLFGSFNSLQAFTGDVVVNLTISILFITGSLGFLVIYELFTFRKPRRLSLHSRLVLVGTGVLLLLGMMVILLLEYNQSLAALPWPGKILAAYFLSATHTAGFSTIDINSTMVSTQVFMMGMMFIGGAPGSTAGGIKVTTLLLLAMTIWSVFSGKKDVEIAKRRISPHDVSRTITIVSISVLVIFLGALLLSIQHHDFLQVLFEVVSATGTVGLSLGLTQTLTPFGRIMIIAIMLFGRLGPVTLGLALAYRPQTNTIRYPEDRIMIG